MSTLVGVHLRGAMYCPTFLLITVLLAIPAGHADPLVRWDRLEKGVRDGKIDQASARKELQSVIPLVRDRWKEIKSTRLWVFPAKGGNVRWIGGTHGEGFRPRSPKPAYSWFDGNRHGGHPGHDVFIPDRNRDCRHDRTDQLIPAVAMQSALVLSINTVWKPGKPRGGEYVWLYNPELDLFFYYAHLTGIAVQPGDVVRAGDRLGDIGKTGFRIRHRNKPCHIHLMVLRFDNGIMTPYDYFRDLGGRR